MLPAVLAYESHRLFVGFVYGIHEDEIGFMKLSSKHVARIPTVWSTSAEFVETLLESQLSEESTDPFCS
jgi:hypothetical protein